MNGEVFLDVVDYDMFIKLQLRSWSNLGFFCSKTELGRQAGRSRGNMFVWRHGTVAGDTKAQVLEQWSRQEGTMAPVMAHWRGYGGRYNGAAMAHEYGAKAWVFVESMAHWC